MKMITKAYRFRLYPTKNQRELLEKSFGCARFVYNYFLAERINKYQTQGKSIGYHTQSKELTVLKASNDYDWLNQVNSQLLQQSIRNLDKAYTNFFHGRANFPKFKKKNTVNTFTIPQKVQLNCNKISFPKFIDGIKLKKHQIISGRIIKAVFSKTSSNKYFVSILTEQEIEQRPKTGREVGIDLGIKDLIITSEGVKFQNNRYLSKYEKKLKKAQQHLSRKKKGSRQYENQRLKVARLHEKISNCRKDTLHKITSRLIRENDAVYLENLNISGMLKNHKLAKNIFDCSWSELARQLEYKGGWYGCEVFKINRFYPSSKTCSHCGCVQDKMSLNVRKWVCPDCGTEHDRDINAAINILMEGKREKSSGAGDYTDGDSINPTSCKGNRLESKKSEIGCCNNR